MKTGLLEGVGAVAGAQHLFEMLRRLVDSARQKGREFDMHDDL